MDEISKDDVLVDLVFLHQVKVDDVISSNGDWKLVTDTSTYVIKKRVWKDIAFDDGSEFSFPLDQDPRAYRRRNTL